MSDSTRRSAATADSGIPERISLRYNFVILIMTLGLLARADYDADAAERKSDWYFMEAMRQKSLGHDALYYAMIGRAAELAPDPADRAVYERSIQDLYLSNALGDSLGLMQALAKSEVYFRANPGDTYAGSYLARVNAELGNHARTLEIYDILELEKPNDIGIVANHAEYLMRLNRLDEAVGLYKSLEKTMGRNPQLTQRIANIRAWQGDTLGALAEVDSLVAAYPRSVEALQLGAVAAGALNMPERVLSYTDRAIELDPTDGPAYYYAANAYKELGRQAEYEQAVRGALMGDDLDMEDKIELLRYYISEIKDREQLEPELAPIFSSLVSQYPQDYAVRKIYFAYLVSLRKLDEAAEQLQHAINIDATNPDDFDALARVYATIDNYSGAAAAINKALEFESLTDTERAEFYTSLGDLAQHDVAIGSPKDFYEKALELDRTNHLAMNNYAYWLSTSGGDLERAKDLISKGILYNPESATYLDTYAWVCYKLGQIEEAQRYIDKALTATDADEDIAELLQHAGDIYNRAGDKEKAKEYWKRAKALDPEIKSE